mmetsp:Transcript_3790/g.5167  ORF Transcript_3790/g.5167 Transcript_3790/m.5167 type:complete len:429 (+) Transcript_3790:95-1381(+)
MQTSYMNNTYTDTSNMEPNIVNVPTPSQDELKRRHELALAHAGTNNMQNSNHNGYHQGSAAPTQQYVFNSSGMLVPKRGRGRPRGSTNKNPGRSRSAGRGSGRGTGRGRGRPRGSTGRGRGRPRMSTGRGRGRPPLSSYPNYQPPRAPPPTYTAPPPPVDRDEFQRRHEKARQLALSAIVGRAGRPRSQPRDQPHHSAGHAPANYTMNDAEDEKKRHEIARKYALNNPAGDPNYTNQVQMQLPVPMPVQMHQHVQNPLPAPQAPTNVPVPSQVQHSQQEQYQHQAQAIPGQTMAHAPAGGEMNHEDAQRFLQSHDDDKDREVAEMMHNPDGSLVNMNVQGAAPSNTIQLTQEEIATWPAVQKKDYRYVYIHGGELNGKFGYYDDVSPDEKALIYFGMPLMGEGPYAVDHSCLRVPQGKYAHETSFQQS